MEAVYRWKGDKRILLYEEGNQILAQVIGTGRTVQWGSLCRDYHSWGISRLWEDEIYVAYVNTENVLMWDKLFAEGRLVLVKGDDWGSISEVQIAQITGEQTQLYVWYRMTDPGDGKDSLYVINPLGERKVQRLVHGTGRIERYEILQHGEVSYLLYKLATENKPRIFAVDVTDSGSKHVYSKISNCLTLIRISALAHSYNTVFFSTDRTNFSFDGHSHSVSYRN